VLFDLGFVWLGEWIWRDLSGLCVWMRELFGLMDWW